MNLTKLFTILIGITIVFMNSCISSKQHRFERKNIVYNSFDAFEDYFEKEITNKNKVFIAIYQINFEYDKKISSKNCLETFQICIGHLDNNVPDYYKNIIHKSNRYLKIKKNYYPIFFEGLDNFWVNHQILLLKK